MPSLVLSPKFPTFPTYKISITLLSISNMSWTEYAPSVAKIIQKSEILSKSQKNDWKLAVYGVLTI